MRVSPANSRRSQTWLERCQIPNLLQHPGGAGHHVELLLLSSFLCSIFMGSWKTVTASPKHTAQQNVQMQLITIHYSAAGNPHCDRTVGTTCTNVTDREDKRKNNAKSKFPGYNVCCTFSWCNWCQLKCAFTLLFDWTKPDSFQLF